MGVFLISSLFIPIGAKAASVPTLNTVKKTIYVGTTYQLKLKNSGEGVKWESSNTLVAQVLETGLVIGIKKGKATITATYDGYKYNCAITVKKPGLNKSKATIINGKKLTLKVKGDTPKSWKSSNNSIVTVSKSGVVKAVGVGSATVSAKCENGTYSCKINVTNPNFKVGDIIKMGKCEQDNNPYNGEETIEWIVLAVEKDKALLISKYILFSKAYNSNASINEPDWETSSLRQWLNTTIYDTIFSSEEKKMILESVVTADTNPEYKDISQGQATKDKLFLLSVKETYEYGANTNCQPVPAVLESDTWMTRSIDYRAWGDRYVGAFFEHRYEAVNSNYPKGVRPAMWIKL